MKKKISCCWMQNQQYLLPKKGHRKLRESSGLFMTKFPNLQGLSSQIIISPLPSSRSMYGSSQKSF